jgi:hypothetical protein
MTTTLVYSGVGVVVLIVLIGFVILRRRPRKINQGHILSQWQDLQKRCVDKSQWVRIIIDADTLLDDVLKRGRYKGKSTGERLVRAQHNLTNNESVWFGHKLRNRIEQEELKKISKQDTLEALSGFRQALKDLGALKEAKPAATVGKAK